MRQDDPLTIWSTRLFQTLLILYPRSFRRDYSREMTLVFRDTCRQTIYRQGTTGLLELWLTTLLDLFSTALAERLAEVTQMSTTALFTRISGLVAAVGGVLLLILVYGEFILGGAGETLGFLMPVYGLCVAIGVAGFYILGQYDEPTSRVGLGLAFIGGLIVTAGLILLVLLDSEPGWTTWVLGMFIYEIGLVVFGGSAFKHKPLPRWNTLPLIVGVLALVTNFAGMIFGTADNEIYFAIWLLVNGLGWVALGALLMLGDKRASYHTGAAA